MAGQLSDAFDESVKANAQIVGGLDDALIEAGRTIADRVDAATSSGEGQEVTKALYLIPHLMNILREMYATPKSRVDAGLTQKTGDTSGALGKLRLAHGKGA